MRLKESIFPKLGEAFLNLQLRDGHLSIFKIQESACQIVKSIGDSAVLHRIASEGLSFAKKPKGLNKKGQAFSENHDRDANSKLNKSCLEMVKMARTMQVPYFVFQVTVHLIADSLNVKMDDIQLT